MTKSKNDGPKSRARNRQKRQDSKYTQALRNGSPASSSAPAQNEAGGVPGPFRLGDLLAECTTFPTVSIEDDLERLTFGFQSKLLGRAIPTGTVLSLAGALAREGVGMELAVESVSHHGMVVTPASPWYDPVRLQMSLLEDWTVPLCPTPRCSQHAIDHRAIDRCHEHLTACNIPTLIRMARWWGQAHRDAHDADPERLGDHRKAALLVKAAVVQGGSETVIEALLLTLFEHEADIEENIWDEAEALAMRHAIARERVRLRGIARDEARRLRKATEGCPTCGKGLYFLPEAPPYPPQYCSPQCAAAQPPAPIS
ncbi:hypothetical protein ACFWBX_11500 [Streptomyces sp. NPDC059991]|uniref:hypothetical protein n=1 Tax=Streptomyces sp. NPDC059991 TaxID=3347028 RepID=UPI00368722AE